MNKIHLIISATLFGGAWAGDKMPADVMLAKELPSLTVSDAETITAPPATYSAMTMNVVFYGSADGAWLTVVPDQAAASGLNAYTPEKTKLLVSGYEPAVERKPSGDYSITFKATKPLTELEKEIGPSPSAEFIDGFEKGVRYGLIAKMGKPDEDNIDELTKEAIKLYALIGRGGMLKIMKQKKAGTAP